MHPISVKVKCRVLLGTVQVYHVMMTKSADGAPFAICDVCDISDSRDACIACWKHVRNVLESRAVEQGMFID